MDVPHFAALRQETRQFGFLLSPELVYRTQKDVRQVVDYLVDRFKRIPLCGFTDDTATQRLSMGDPLHTLLREPWPGVPQSRVIPELLRDALLWDRWAAILVTDDGGQPRLKRLPPRTWVPLLDGFDQVHSIRIGGQVDLDVSQVFLWCGRSGGQHPMRALQAALQELITGQSYRQQLFERGGRFPAVVHRPAEAPGLTPEALSRLQQDFNALWAGDDSPTAGGMPILEEGMTLHDSRAFSPADQQYLEGVQLGTVSVCNFYHVAPELLGARAGNQASTDQYRQGLYVETLGPHYVSIQDEFNVQVVPTVKPGAWVEFDMDEALRGSFLEEAEALSRATGAPWMVRDEARERKNMAALPDGQGTDVVTPLNVVTGSLPSPAATAPDETPFPKSLDGRKALGQAAQAPALAERYGDQLAAALSTYFRDQGQDVLRLLGAGKADNTPPLDWPTERYDSALAQILYGYTPAIASAGAHHALQRLDPDYPWSDDPMLKYLRAGADRTAHSVNEQTRTAVLAAVGSSNADGWQQRVSDIFDAAAAGRASSLARAMTTHCTNFGQMEAGKATGATTKRWHVTSPNPRTSHALLNGVSIPMAATFPNGCRWPGDPNGSADEVAGCTCTLEVGP